ncbi:PPE domain-containing protein [Saccharomonospora viridis]|jgi:hypothetical protein|uniref:PPE domain-containing protein n=1 Tax=Saccharomonospora viridis TaxID=1852 RepID=UPI00240A3986|nr:PE-PGRS family protein [Saccharomonospora viridis]
MTRRPADDRRYESYAHERMYAEVGTDNDPAVAGEIGREWTKLARELREVGDTLAALSEASERAWQGGAAESMRSVLRDAVAWTEQAADVSDTVGQAVVGQAEAAARAKAEMPEPVSYDPAAMIREAASAGDVWRLVGLSDAMAARRDEAEHARQQAVDVMYARSAALGSAVPDGEFPTPPRLTSTGESDADGGTGRGTGSTVGRSVPV